MLNKSVVVVIFLLLVLSSFDDNTSAVQVENEEMLVLQVEQERVNASEALQALNNVTDDFIDNPVSASENSWQQMPRWAQILLCVIAMIVGLVNCYYGYKLFKFSVFIIGGFIIFLIMLGILDASISNDVSNRVAIIFGVSGACWLVGGIILVIFIPFAIFLLGAAIGVTVAIILNPICLYLVWPENPTANLYIWMAIFGLITGIITCWFERPIMIVSTVFCWIIARDSWYWWNCWKLTNHVQSC